MPTKLTLRLDEELIQVAKDYSRKSGKSVSRIVADLFEFMRNEKPGRTLDDSPATCSLKGVLKDATVSAEDYRAHLRDKYL